ncbi:MAG: acyl-CoA dehydrogenase [Betaproteobacteria bacterium]|nr:acyl-CoA dehydrogenase [Betaproteobacteria bacterium]
MNFELPPELTAMREALRKFVKAELEPLEDQIDRSGELPPGLLPLMGKHGYLSMRLPTEVGGAGMGLFPYALMLEEFSRSHRIFGLVASGGGGLTPIAIARHGSREQREKYLTGLINGTLRTAFALTEPAAGSDNSAMTTRAEKKDGGWVINGRKHYINSAHDADFITVIAITDAVKRTRGGVTAFLVDKGTPGFNVTRVDTTMGSAVIKLAEIEFDNCKVPDSARLGPEGQGFNLAKESLRDGRMGVSCSCIGMADRLLAMSAAHAKTRITFGKPLAERQAIQWMLADSEVDIAAARAMVYDTLRQIDEGKDVGTAPSICKLYCSEMVGRVADRAVQIHGGMGIVQGYPVERMYRDVRHYRIGEGSSEVQRMLIAKDVLKRV